MAINLDSPPLYDVLTKKQNDYLSEIWQSWLGTFYQTLVQKFELWSLVINNLTMEITNGYYCNGATQLSLLLPVTADVGDYIEVAAINAAGWKVIQNATQQIQVGSVSTTLGITGSLSSGAIGDTVKISCYITNTHWIVLSSANLSSLIVV